MTRGAIKRVLKDQANNIHAFPTSRAKQNFYLSPIKPLTRNQSKVFKAYDAGKNLLLTGVPGSGKSFLSLYLALKEVTLGISPYKKVIIVRSAVSTRDIGALPGGIEDKTNVYELPYHLICADLFNEEGAYGKLKEQHVISFLVSSFVRGITFSDAIVIIDEAQNTTSVEIYSIISRVGENCRVIVCGDTEQTDYMKNQISGFPKMIKVLKFMESFESVDFEVDDIVRSKFLKDFYLAWDNYREE